MSKTFSMKTCNCLWTLSFHIWQFFMNKKLCRHFFVWHIIKLSVKRNFIAKVCNISEHFSTNIWIKYVEPIQLKLMLVKFNESLGPEFLKKRQKIPTHRGYYGFWQDKMLNSKETLCNVVISLCDTLCKLKISVLSLLYTCTPVEVHVVTKSLKPMTSFRTSP